MARCRRTENPRKNLLAFNPRSTINRTQRRTTHSKRTTTMTRPSLNSASSSLPPVPPPTQGSIPHRPPVTVLPRRSRDGTAGASTEPYVSNGHYCPNCDYAFPPLSNHIDQARDHRATTGALRASQPTVSTLYKSKLTKINNVPFLLSIITN